MSVKSIFTSAGLAFRLLLFICLGRLGVAGILLCALGFVVCAFSSSFSAGASGCSSSAGKNGERDTRHQSELIHLDRRGRSSGQVGAPPRVRSRLSLAVRSDRK
jgi:hypothetical protein